MTTSSLEEFKLNNRSLQKHLRLKSLQPKTIEAYSRSIRRVGRYFDHGISSLSEKQLLDYFSDLLDSQSWSTVKLDLYGLTCYYRHVLGKPWTNIDLIKPPRVKRLPDIVSTEEAAALFRATRKISYRVLYLPSNK